MQAVGHAALLDFFSDGLKEELAEREQEMLVPADQVAKLASALIEVVRRHVTDEIEKPALWGPAR